MLIMALLFTGISLSQILTPYNAMVTLTKDSTKTDSVMIVNGLIPVGIFLDSLNIPTTAYFEISFGKQANRKWYRVGKLSDTTNYTIPVIGSIYIPLDNNVFAGILGTLNIETPVWLRVRVANAQTYTKKIFIRMRYF